MNLCQLHDIIQEIRGLNSLRTQVVRHEIVLVIQDTTETRKEKYHDETETCTRAESVSV